MPWRTLKDRFLAKFKINETSGCWEWTAHRNKDGYGTISSNYKPKPAHRASYEIYCGEIPNEMMVLHRCDNRSCVNPEHLFLGTHAINMADMALKKRAAAGSRHTRPVAKLSESEAAAIISANGRTQRELAAEFGVGQDQISRIRSGKRWAYLHGELR